MSLELWLENGWLKEHKPTPREIAELLAVADRALQDCQVDGLSRQGVEVTGVMEVGEVWAVKACVDWY